jgi:hypothetical protein
MTPHLSRPRRLKTIGRRVKAPAAAIGAAVFVGIGGFGVAFNHSAAAGASVPAPTGQTIVQSTPAREPATPVASPSVTAPRFVGGHWLKGITSTPNTTRGTRSRVTAANGTA